MINEDTLAHRAPPRRKQGGRRGLKRFEIFSMLICAIVGLDTLGATAALGPEGLTWLLIVAVAFFVPYGLITAELSSAFPAEGGPYVWTRLAFGRVVAAVSQFLYWVSNPIWVGGTLCVVAIATFSTFLVPLDGAAQIIAGLAFVWAGFVAVNVSLRFGKWILVIGAIARMTILALFIGSLGLYALKYGVQPFDARSFAPTALGLVSLFPVFIFCFMGLELPSAASDELENPKRDMPAALLRSGTTAIAMYAVPLIGIFLVVPRDQLSSLTGFLEACRRVFAVYGGSISSSGEVTLSGAGALLSQVAAWSLIIGLFTSGIAWAAGQNRAQAIAFADGCGPAVLGEMKDGVPRRINLISALIASIVMVAASLLTAGDIQKYFSAGLSLVISTSVISYVFILSSAVILRRRFPDVARPYRVPGGRAGLAIVSVFAVASVVFGAAQLLWPGLGAELLDRHSVADDFLPQGFAGQRFDYALSQFVPLALIVTTALIFFGRRSRSHRSSTSTTPLPQKVLTP